MLLYNTNTIVVRIKTLYIQGNSKINTMDEVKIKVDGMNCNHCKINVESNLKKIKGIQVAVADLIHGEVTLKGDDINLDTVKSSLESIGYSFGGKLT
jgi:copper chaperone CopZ